MYLTESHSMVVDLLRSTSSCFSGEVMESADVVSRFVLRRVIV